MTSMQTNLSLARLIKAVRKHASFNRRLPFLAHEYEGVDERTLLMEGVATMLEDNVAKYNRTPTHEVTESGILQKRIADLEVSLQERDNIISAFNTQIAATLSVMASTTTSDLISVAITRMEQLRDSETDLDDAMNHLRELVAVLSPDVLESVSDLVKDSFEIRTTHEVDEDSLQAVDQVRPALNRIKEALEKIENAPVMGKHSTPQHHEIISEIELPGFIKK